MIIPSLLAANPLEIAQEITALMQIGLNTIHLDIMDNHYVPNLSFSPALCQAIHQRFPKLTLDVHLMTAPVDDLIEKFASAGATRISIHPDASLNLSQSLKLIKALNCKAGIALNPSASIDCLKYYRSQLDFVLIMTVNPGFGGQKLIAAMLDKIKLVHQLYPDLIICVDGGVALDNTQALISVGAIQFIVGSSLFKSSDYAKTLDLFKQTFKPT